MFLKMATDNSRVLIGYLEKCELWKLESRFFPSKVGGKPAWLDLKDIGVDLKCGRCSKPYVFLCQVYAPIEDLEAAYHRMIYIFVCRDPECSKLNDGRNFNVYRCQLMRSNEFYSPDEPVKSIDWHPDATVEKYAKTCRVCGCLAPSQCGNCKTTRYCSREHQIIDWKSGHNKMCGSSESAESHAKILFPEYEIIDENEIQDEEDAEMLKKPVEKSEEERLKEYEDFVSQMNVGSQINLDPKLVEEMALSKEDKYLKKFKERLKLCPDQVVRYDRGGEPLWISKPNVDAQIPNCELCGSPRVFEFQVLPTLLSYLDVDSLGKSIDWGTLIVYTCKNSCSGAPSYKKEFLLKQDVS